MIHALSDVQSTRIGAGTRVWQYCVVLPGAVIGSDCNICSHCFIENDVVIGDRVTIKNGVHVWDGVVLEDDVFIGANVSFSNDRWPRSGQHQQQYPATRICRGASVGANASLLPGITIGEGAMVGSGAVVTRSVPAGAVVVGNPARIVRYVHGSVVEGAALASNAPDDLAGVEKTDVKGVDVHYLRVASDIRGQLSVGEFSRDIPFVPARYFIVYDVPTRETRGEHAHRCCRQFFVCLRGSCTVIVDDGVHRTEIVLDVPNKGLDLPPMVWTTQHRYSEDAILLVFASHPYDPADYIRSYAEFLAACGLA